MCVKFICATRSNHIFLYCIIWRDNLFLFLLFSVMHRWSFLLRHGKPPHKNRTRRLQYEYLFYVNQLIDTPTARGKRRYGRRRRSFTPYSGAVSTLYFCEYQSIFQLSEKYAATLTRWINPTASLTSPHTRSIGALRFTLHHSVEQFMTRMNASPEAVYCICWLCIPRMITNVCFLMQSERRHIHFKIHKDSEDIIHDLLTYTYPL